MVTVASRPEVEGARNYMYMFNLLKWSQSVAFLWTKLSQPWPRKWDSPARPVCPPWSRWRWAMMASNGFRTNRMAVWFSSCIKCTV